MRKPDRPGHRGHLSLLLGAVWLTGCGVFGFDTGLTNTEDTARDGPIGVDSLNPATGPTAGGTSVTVSGWGFGDSPAVGFGGKSVEVTSLDDSSFTFVTPAGELGPVDMSVSSDNGFAIAEDAFSYTEGGSGGGDTGGGTPPTEEGKAAVVQINYLYNLCPTCFVPPLDSEEASAMVGFFEATEVEFLDHLPSPGSCTSNLAASDPPLSFLDAGDFAYLTSGSRSITLTRTLDGSDITYEASTAAGSMSASAIAHSAAYDLATLGGSDLAGFTVEDAVYTAQFFDSLNPDTSGMFEYLLSRSTSTTWSWSPAGTGANLFLIMLEFYNPNSGALRGYSVCNGYDSGSMTVPASAITGQARDLVVISFLRYEQGTFTTPWNGAEGVFLGVTGVRGTATVR